VSLPAEGILPRSSHTLNRDTTTFGQAKTHIVPVVRKLDARLNGRDDREDVIFGSFKHALEDGQVRFWFLVTWYGA